jgi:hypothetical protein
MFRIPFMAHRLSVGVKYSIGDNRYSGLLQKGEIPRGLPISVTYYIGNLGTQYFSGSIKEITTTLNETPSGSYSAIIRENPERSITDLPPGETWAVYQSNIQMQYEGKGLFRCILESFDDEDIEYFISDDPRQENGSNSWSYEFNVINREQLETISMLKEIRDKIP